MVDVRISGLDGIQLALLALPDALVRRALVGGVAKAASEIRQEAIQRAPVYTGAVQKGHPPPGTLKKAIYQTRRKGGRLEVVFGVGMRSGVKWKAVKRGRGSKATTLTLDAFYWKWVEFGTRKMAARPFMRPAFEAKKFQAIEAMRRYLAQRLNVVAQDAKKG